MAARQRRMTLTCQSALLVFAVSAAVACGRSDSNALWAESPDSVAFRTITGIGTACSDCISVTELVTLGRDTANGRLEDNGTIDYVVRDRAGRYWVGQKPTVKVFAEDGSYLRAVGRRGKGPREFEFAQPVHVDTSGMVHVFDVTLGRETVFGPDFTVQRESQIPLGIDAMAPLPGGSHRYVIQSWIPTPDRLGLPLHVISGTEILNSFGAPSEPSKTFVTPARVLRILTTDSAGYIYSSELDKYAIEVRTEAGSRVAGFEHHNLNAHTVRPGVWAFDNPPPNLVVDMAAEGGHRLWVISRHRRSAWQGRVVERVSRRGMPYLEPKDGRMTSVYRSRIDVLDLNTASVVASRVHEGLLLRFVKPGVISELVYADKGILLRLLQLTLEQPPKTRLPTKVGG